jgi:hypothetical protein
MGMDNLELPSCEQEKLEIGSNSNVDDVVSADGMHVEEEVLNSPTTSEQVEEVDGPNLSEIVVSVCNEFDVNTIVLNVDKVAIHEPHNGLEFVSKEAAILFLQRICSVCGIWHHHKS